MSLIRTAVVAGVAIYAIPTDPQKQQALLQSASDGFVWGATYCQREPETCRQAEDFLRAALQKAKFGAAFVAEVASKWPKGHGDAVGDHDRSVSAAGGQRDLTIEDILAASPEQLDTGAN